MTTHAKRTEPLKDDAELLELDPEFPTDRISIRPHCFREASSIEDTARGAGADEGHLGGISRRSRCA